MLEFFLINKIKRLAFRVITLAVIAFFSSSVLAVLAYRFIPVYVTPLMFIRSGEYSSEDRNVKLKKTWVPIRLISKNLVNAVVASEDAHFMTHDGFDWDGIKAAYESNKSDDKGGKSLRGGSTISQQTAKNVFLWPKQSWVRKGFEAYFTVLIEFFWSKERIMEVYLNVIEMGDPGIFGAQAAAEHYFGINASELDKKQSALIAACLPNPHVYNINNPSAYVRKRQNRILKLMNSVQPVQLKP